MQTSRLDGIRSRGAPFSGKEGAVAKKSGEEHELTGLFD